MSNIYRDDPPSEPGWYWVKYKKFRGETIREINPGYPSHMEIMQDHFKFGPRVPDAQKCQEIERGSDHGR